MCIETHLNRFMWSSGWFFEIGVTPPGAYPNTPLWLCVFLWRNTWSLSEGIMLHLRWYPPEVYWVFKIHMLWFPNSRPDCKTIMAVLPGGIRYLSRYTSENKTISRLLRGVLNNTHLGDIMNLSTCIEKSPRRYYEFGNSIIKPARRCSRCIQRHMKVF